MYNSQTSPGGNVWFITGTSSGLGRRLALSALARGDMVIATARSLTSLKAHHSDVPPFPTTSPEVDRLKLLELDVTSPQSLLDSKIREAMTCWGRIDVLVNNAGYGFQCMLEEGGSKIMKEVFETNFFGAVNVTNSVLPYMRARRSGTVVMTGSRSAWKNELPGLGAYSASKAAVHSYAETLAVEVSPLNIRVLHVAPGAFRTEGIYTGTPHLANPIEDYEALREPAVKRYQSMGGTQRGDPDKAMEALVDVVRGEGLAKGRKWPGLLVLGDDAERDIRTKMEKITRVLDEWTDVTRSLNFPDGL